LKCVTKQQSSTSIKEGIKMRKEEGKEEQLVKNERGKKYKRFVRKVSFIILILLNPKEFNPFKGHWFLYVSPDLTY
jgi:hypothetical protein